MTPPLVGALFDGAIDIVGDVHGECDVLRELLDRLGYDADGLHPEGRRLVFVGDLGDRGPDSPGVVELVRALIERGRAQCIAGNHELNLLRGIPKHGNRWYTEPGHAEQQPDGEFAHSRPAPPGHTYHAFFLSLPLVLERDDLRVVHASWHAPSIAHLRASTQTTLELFEHHERAIHEHLERSGIAAAAHIEKERYRGAFQDPATPVPPLPNLGKQDELRQTMNPVRVVTSGPERVTEQPFYANGKWRMCDRVQWWNEYTDDTPVIVGHYWRVADHDDEDDEPNVSGGKPNLFEAYAAHHWVGARRNVFCVDFSIGGRYRELSRGATVFRTRLAAVRWPERVVMFHDGTTSPMHP